MARLATPARRRQDSYSYSKTHFAQDMILEKDTPIFCTGPSRIRKFSRDGDANEVESEMMEVRWKVFVFFHQLRTADVMDVPSCPRCFTNLVLE